VCRAELYPMDMLALDAYYSVLYEDRASGVSEII
jgi:hypothetical protein